MNFGRMIMQWMLMPPINIHFNFHTRPLRSLSFFQDRAKPTPAKFDPKRKIDDRAARMIAASNALSRNDGKDL